MASWSDVGDWLKANAGSGAALVGSLLTGNIPGAVAAGVALVGSATGHATPDAALAQLQADPASLIRLRELAIQDEASIREHVRAMEQQRLQDLQAEHQQTQETVRSGDNAEEPYVRLTRPRMARQSWAVTAIYVLAAEALRIAAVGTGPSWEFAALLSTPAWAYLGLRTYDKARKVPA